MRIFTATTFNEKESRRVFSIVKKIAKEKEVSIERAFVVLNDLAFHGFTASEALDTMRLMNLTK